MLIGRIAIIENPPAKKQFDINSIHQIFSLPFDTFRKYKYPHKINLIVPT